MDIAHDVREYRSEQRNWDIARSLLRANGTGIPESDLFEEVKGSLLPSRTELNSEFSERLRQLRSRGLIEFETQGPQLYVRLTDRARKALDRAGTTKDEGEPWPYDYEA